MPKLSAGLLLYRVRGGRAEVMLVHPGGPLWKHKDSGAWSLPKGEVSSAEDPLETARREFEEETGVRPQGKLIPLGEIKQKGGKIVRAWAFKGNCDPTSIRSNTFRMEWPPRSGKVREFPEIDKAEFFSLAEARKKINPAQVAFLDNLEQVIERGR